MITCVKCGKEFLTISENCRCESCEKDGHPYQDGYIQALQDYGIWRNGVQYIGCLETPIKEIIHKKFGVKL